MSEQPDTQESVQFDQAHEKLTRGLRLCHSLVDDYRMKLAANTHADAANDSDADASDSI